MLSMHGKEIGRDHIQTCGVVDLHENKEARLLSFLPYSYQDRVSKTYSVDDCDSNRKFIYILAPAFPVFCCPCSLSMHNLMQ